MSGEKAEKTEAKRLALKRLYGLLDLQKELEQKFESTQYNVFVFGSYITIDYIEGVSDIDIAIYTEDFELYKKISLYLERYFQEKQVKSDIFYIDLHMAAPVYLAPLNSKVQFTEFYPQCLKEFKDACQEKLDQIKIRMVS